jgi:formylglycine-generating enzyme required for sulfatase activity
MRHWLSVLVCTWISCAGAGAHPAFAGEAKREIVIDLGGGVTMEFVLVPSGSFTMGSEKSPLKNEKPAHMRTIEQAFYLGKFEVTQEQWAAIMGETPSIHKGPLYPESARHPVENISWSYSKVFLARLVQKVSGYQFRLPSEAEWEYACRAGSRDDYHFGDDAGALDEYAWYSNNSNGQTHPVGRKRPNAWGLYDMHGNVWEWCEDAYAPYAAGPGNRANESASTLRVLRGGAFNNIPKNLRAAYRHDLLPDDSFRYYGLRVVAVIDTSR